MLAALEMSRGYHHFTGVTIIMFKLRRRVLLLIGTTIKMKLGHENLSRIPDWQTRRPGTDCTIKVGQSLEEENQ